MRVSHALVRPPGSVIGSLWIRKAATAYGRSNARRRPGRCGRCSPPGSRFVGAVRLGARLSGAVGAMGAPPQLQALLLAVNTLLRKRRYHAALAMVKGFRNGAVYGAKIRAPHALVMTFLFRSGSLWDKLRAILQGTYTHSWNLACFVFTYKGLCTLQSRVQGETSQVHSFLAAFIGGLLLFGDNNNINSQINMYLMSRVLIALCRLGVEKGYIPKPRWNPFPLFAATLWGLVLWLFEYHRPTLQPSLQSSMTYLYEDSNVWHDLSDFLIYNKSRPAK